MYSLYKDPSGEVNLDFSNIATNLSGMRTRGNDVVKKVEPKMLVSNVYKASLYSSNNSNALCYNEYRKGIRRMQKRFSH